MLENKLSRAGVAGLNKNKANSACPAKLELGLGLSLAITKSPTKKLVKYLENRKIDYLVRISFNTI